MAISDSGSEEEEGGCEKYLLFLGVVDLGRGEDLRRLEARGVVLGVLLEAGVGRLRGVVAGAGAAAGLAAARRGIVRGGMERRREELLFVGEQDM